MNPEQLLYEIRTYCESHENAESLQKYQRFFKGGYDGYGLTTIQITSKVKSLLTNNEVNPKLVVQAMPLLMESGKYEETSFGLLLIDAFSKNFDKNILAEIDNWFKLGINNWAHADTLAMYILPKLISQKAVDVQDFKPWLSSTYKFQRRCVPVTLIKSIKKADDINSLLEFVEPLMMDSDREVHQGVGWFLREVWKIYPAQVEVLLDKWKERAPRLIFQYACEKMDKEYKLQFKRPSKK